ncbi:hypothetical protein C8F01DRAFT_1124474 [Mycena amicta]|nr:hypothetical protein C8F01DRAFT_1161203 [Mycena amicta]KAJ7065168.1 hypothetical protein C8F01DRAFT_1124474 [Mycena amicta]
MSRHPHHYPLPHYLLYPSPGRASALLVIVSTASWWSFLLSWAWCAWSWCLYIAFMYSCILVII